MQTTYTLAALLLGRPPGVTSEASGEDGTSGPVVVLAMGVLVACGKSTVGCVFDAAFGVAGATLGVLGVLALGLFTGRFR